ncbi:MAG TPA: restriction endonuclease subunit S [Sulfuriferula sp.]|nr:restriction endonuclease subunit S [Sulfuriferula sp.]
MSLLRYPTYKDSGVAWLGEVPVHWEVKRIGYYFDERREKVSDKDFDALSVTKNGVVPQLETAAKTDDGDNRKKVCKGDFVINSRSDRKGSSGASDLDGSVSLINTVLRPRDEIAINFAHHVLRSQPFQEEYYRFGKGIVADLWSTNYSEMKNVSLAVPPVPEQQTIAAFLDRETGKIDALVAEQQRLVELLAEKRQAVISHAVTKGLNPNVPMKDSGIEWLGEVPAHWGCMPMKYLVRLKSGGTPSKDQHDYWDGSIPWASGKDMKVEILSDTVDHITELAIEQGAATLIEQGVVLVVVRGMILARTFPVALTGERMAINQDLKAVFAGTKLQSAFLAWYLRGTAEESLRRLDEAAHGTKALRMEAWTSMEVALPPLDEQVAIANFLGRTTSQLDTLTAEANRAIALLQERRSALISAAVTGKIDVRQAA